MFAPPVTKPKSALPKSPTFTTQPRSQVVKGEREQGNLAAHETGWEPARSWSFSNIPLFPPDGTGRPQNTLSKPPSIESALAEPGRKLDDASLEYFQRAFGHDLSPVRLHTSATAASSAKSLSARAYTVGRHIVLGQGEYAPGTTAGRRVLGHELAHVIQQSRGGSTASNAETPTLEASARRATAQVAGGYPVFVMGAAPIGIARLSLFDEFSSGVYSWPILRLALINTRPVDKIITDIASLSSSERDQAIKDITAERTSQARKLADLVAKQNAQTDPALQAVFNPMMPPVGKVISKADQILDGLFATIAVSETPASLKVGTVAPTAAQKPLIESALKPDLRVTSAGTVAPFEENPAGDPACANTSTCYLDKLRAATPPLVEAHHKQQVDNRGKTEHSDPTKVHALSELERVGNASKRETDNVFGQYKKGPALKADTKRSRGNIHDLWQDTETRLKGMTLDEKREMARQLVFYFFQSDSEIGAINTVHNADPKFSSAGAPLNQEATDQKKVVDESTTNASDVQRLNEIDRGWDASAQAGQVNVQVFKPPDQTSGPLAGPKVADRDFLWDMFQTLVHEYLHTLAHPDYNKFADSFGGTSNQFNTLVEGVDSLLDEVVWSAVAPHVTDQKLRDDVEGPEYSGLPPINVFPASRRRYASYAQAIKLVNIVGIRNLYAAYFLGDVKKIKV